MIVTDHAIFLQLPKAATSRIADLMLSTVGGEERAKHGRLRRDFRDDPELSDKFVFGSVRDPHAYYVSIWAYGCRRAGGLYELTTGRPSQDQPVDRRDRLATKKTVPYDERDRRARKRARRWAETYEDSHDADGFRTWLAYANHPDYRGDLGMGLGKSAIAEWAGLLTYRFCWMYLLGCVPGEPHDELGSRERFEAEAAERYLCDGMVRVEHLVDELEAMLVAAGHELSEEQRAALRASGDRRQENRSDHRPTDWYYDDDARSLVADRDAVILDRFY